MNSRGSSSDDGIESSDAAARRAGITPPDGLSSGAGSTLEDPAQPEAASQDIRDVADIHQRLDSITRQIDQLSNPAADSGEPAVARQLNDAISRLDARLARVAAQTAGDDPQQRMADRGLTEIYNRSPSPDSVTLESAIAEVVARQHELDEASRATFSNSSAPLTSGLRTPRPATDFSSLERQLFKITSQIESLQRPEGIEQSIAAFRIELAGIRHVITEAMPRRAIESIENEIRSLSRRIEEVRHNGSDGQALASIEQALNEIHEALRSLKPAEQLAGFDEAIRNLGGKIDTIVRDSGDSGMTQQLENAIGALRSIVSNVASNDALERLSNDLSMLSSKVDQLNRPESHGDSFSALEQRMAALTATLENREGPAPGGSSEQLEEVVRALSERLDRLPAGHDSSSALAHLEQRVSLLLERLETASDHSGSHLGRVEEGLQDILRCLERQQAGLVAMSENGPRSAAPTMDSEVVEAIKRELSEMRFCQSENDRHTQDSLEAVHNTLEHVVDRLAMIESDLRAVRAMPTRAEPSRGGIPERAADLPPKPELPNPVLSQMATPPAPTLTAKAASTPHAKADVLIPRDTSDADRVAPSVTAPSPRPAIDPALPPDHPLEPGTRPAGRPASPPERIAASESAIGAVAEAPRDQSGSSFIAAARRAAKAAAAAGASPDKSGRTKVAIEPARPATGGSDITSKIRSLLVAASVIVIVLSSFKFAMTLLDSPPREILSESGPAAPVTTPPAEAEPGAEIPPSPSTNAPTPIDRHSMVTPPAGDSAAPTEEPSDVPASQRATTSADITGTIPDEHVLEPAATSPSESLPDSIGGATLRTAALQGDAAAAFEVGVRYAEGKGVAVNYNEAAKWYERAAHAGIVPAMFRLGTLHEKGLGASKDIDAARRYYMLAADRGNAKAMHNLAVLDADGGGKGADYTSAAQWFRKAAERGIADSQFNLGILYARGIGVEQNLAKSYKWFSLAAAQGDVDSGRKRDEVAKRLDAQSLAAAKLAVQTFVPTPQPDDAVKVPSPAGGWDSAAAKPHAKTAPRKAATANPATRHTAR
ncbi:MAG: hypothetical protein K5821_10640 [Nitrobacter sp.]|uniref:hypothetical protein n=1 Tax=Nitrobacter sp. TaxID=29420 RepID=UPI00261B4C09|nr:hypothetical protein [Nitrobacter sp.]MCV0386880.1 hypothetical protein [Nitrobacter sp.]